MEQSLICVEGGTKKAQTLSPTAQVTATRMLELSFCLGVQVSLWLLYTTISVYIYKMYKIFHFYTYQNRKLIHVLLNLNIFNSMGGGGGTHLNFYQMHVHYGLICRIK